jgi:ribosomal protein L37AE/L43A
MICPDCNSDKIKEVFRNVFECESCSKMGDKNQFMKKGNTAKQDRAEGVEKAPKIFNLKDFVAGSKFIEGSMFQGRFSEEYDSVLCGQRVSQMPVDDATYSIDLALATDAKVGTVRVVMLFCKNDRFIGVFRVEEIPVLDNIIDALGRFKADFNKKFEARGKIRINSAAGVPLSVKNIKRCIACDRQPVLKRTDPDNLTCDYCNTQYPLDKETSLVMVDSDPTELSKEYVSNVYAPSLEYSKPIAGIMIGNKIAFHQALVVVEENRSRRRKLQFATMLRDKKGELKAMKGFKACFLHSGEDLDKIIEYLVNLKEMWRFMLS